MFCRHHLLLLMMSVCWLLFVFYCRIASNEVEKKEEKKWSIRFHIFVENSFSSSSWQRELDEAKWREREKNKFLDHHFFRFIISLNELIDKNKKKHSMNVMSTKEKVKWKKRIFIRTYSVQKVKVTKIKMRMIILIQ